MLRRCRFCGRWEPDEALALWRLILKMEEKSQHMLRYKCQFGLDEKLLKGRNLPTSREMAQCSAAGRIPQL